MRSRSTGVTTPCFTSARPRSGSLERSDLALHRAIGSPVAFGCLRPCIVVPINWSSWPNAQRRACLLHEMTHLKRRDDWSKLAQELISIFFFFHPLVRWLLARLDRERELLCDEAVVAYGMEPASYARILLEMARRPGRILTLPSRVPSALLPVLERRTVAIRITRLLQDDMSITLSRSSLRRSVGLGVLAGVVSLAMMGIRIRAVEPRTSGSSQEAELTRKIEGLIVDPDGQPSALATVVAGFDGTGVPNHQVFQTDKNGRFDWLIPDKAIAIYFVAYKEDFAPGFYMLGIDPAVRVHRAEQKLERPATFAGILVDRDDKPLPGATIRAEAFVRASETTDQNGQVTGGGASYQYVRQSVVAGSPLEMLFTAKTDAKGSFVFPALGQCSGVRLNVTATDGQRYFAQPEAPPGKPLFQWIEKQGFVSTASAAEAHVAVSPAARIAGRVTTRMCGVTVAGRIISIQDSSPPGQVCPMANFTSEPVRTGGEGRFQIDDLRKGRSMSSLTEMARTVTGRARGRTGEPQTRDNHRGNDRAHSGRSGGRHNR